MREPVAFISIVVWLVKVEKCRWISKDISTGEVPLLGACAIVFNRWRRLGGKDETESVVKNHEVWCIHCKGTIDLGTRH